MKVAVTAGKDFNRIDKFQNHIYIADSQNDIKDGLVLLYVYKLPDAENHGYKVGMTRCKLGETYWHALVDRIYHQKKELCLSDEDYEKYGANREILFWGICINDNSDDFQDHAIHKKIIEKMPGLVEREHEWFYGFDFHLITIKEIFEEYRTSGEAPYEIYTPREEQREAIDSIKEYFSNNPYDKRYLLNCKMRFGKCYTVYKYAEETKKRKIIVLTFVPAVENEWRGNLKHIETKYKYFTDDDLGKSDFKLENNPTTPYVVFLSLQNYLGKDSESKKTKEKIKKLSCINFDLLVLDEYHFGAWNNRTQETIEDFDKIYQEKLKKEKKQLDIAEKFNINVKETICLSGTPYKVLDKGEFTDQNTYSYSYFDEQKRKYPNSENDDFETINSKYKQFPDMEINGYNVTSLFGGMATEFSKEDKIISKRNFFSLNKFFETENDTDPRKECKFIYENQVKILLETMTGTKNEEDFVFPYQYTNAQYVKHSLWLMPTINACIAMANLLKKDDYYSNYEIINISDPSVGSGRIALDYLNEQMLAGEQKGKRGSITLTVNKLTLGVTVSKWSACLVLKDLASPEQYFQSIFRIQNPLLDKDGEPIKKKCKVYDFNIDRATALLLKYAEECNSEQVTKLQIAELIVKYLPIYLNGKVSEKIGVRVFYDMARYDDTGSKPLSQRVTDTTRTTHMDDQTIADMINDPECCDVIKKVFAHKKFEKPSEHTHAVEGVQYHRTSEYKKGSDIGYKEGEKRFNEFLELDEAQDHLDECIKTIQKETIPYEYNDEQTKWYCDGVADGFFKGINAPIKKMKCGEADGIKFATEVIKTELGETIQYNDNTKQKIRDIINNYLNDWNNIPEQYRKQIYRKWYADSFKNAAIRSLKPDKFNDGELGVEDVNNVLKHILARLFQFLYISVYRETTFEEIFNNADPEVFLAAVGIKKEDFQILNKYHIFQEQILNRYIHEFFVNETLGKTITAEELENDNYRNSFNWFGFGIEN